MPDVETTRRRQRHGPGFQRVAPVILFVINFILQLPTVVIGCFNSEPKVLYSSIILGLSYLSVLPWIIELVLRWTRRVPLLSPSPTGNKPFFSFADVVGLPSAVCQSIFTTVNLVLLVRHSNTQIKISALAILFALVQLLSTFYAGTDPTKSGQTDYVPSKSMSSDIDLPRYKYPKSPTVTQDFKETCRRCFRCCSQITIEQRFAIINFINELPAIVLDQVSFEPKSLHAMILMPLSIVALLLYFIELPYKTQCCKRSNKGPRISPNKPSFILEFTGLLSAVLQPIFTVVNYVLARRHGGELQISVLPILFALGLACYKFQDSRLNNIEPLETESEGSAVEDEEIDQRVAMTPRVIKDDRVPLETESEGSAVENDEIDQRMVMTPRAIEDDWVPLETESEGSAAQDELINYGVFSKMTSGIHSLRAELRGLTAEISDIHSLPLRAELGYLKAEISHMLRVLAKLGGLTAVISDTHSLRAELGGLTAGLTAVIPVIHSLRAELGGLSAGLTAVISVIHSLRAELGGLTAEIKSWFKHRKTQYKLEKRIEAGVEIMHEIPKRSEACINILIPNVENKKESVKTWAIEKKKESAQLKKGELMRESAQLTWARPSSECGLILHWFHLNNIGTEDEENKGSVTPPRPSHGVDRRVNGDDRVPLETESEGSAVEDEEIDERVAMTPRVNEDDRVPLETESEGSAVEDDEINVSELERRVQRDKRRLERLKQRAERERLTEAGEENKKESVKTWVIEKKKESAQLKKRELMREPTRRNVVNGLRRRVRRGR